VFDLPTSRMNDNILVFRIPSGSFARTGTKVNSMQAEARFRPRAAYPYPAVDVALATPATTFVVGK